MRAKAKLRFEDLPNDYAALCRLLLPRPVRDTVDYENAAEMVEAMVLWHEDFTPDQRDYFDLLCSLIEDYDAEHVNWPKVAGLDVLKHLMAEHGMSPADLSRVLGASRNLGAMLLRGDRNLTLAHVRKLAEHFNVSPELFIS